MIINTNITALQAASHLGDSQKLLSKSISRLSTGSRITSSTDDAAGLAVAANLEAQTKRVVAARGNVSSAVSYTQAQDGYLKKVAQALDRMSELAIMAQDVIKSADDRALYQKEFGELARYINDMATKTFNDVTLFDGSTLNVTIDSEGNTYPIGGVDLGHATYVAATSADLTVDPVAALAAVNAAIDKVGEDRATVGSYHVFLNYTADQLTIVKENLTAATSRIQDVDMAEESTEFARHNILLQSATAMLAQANQVPQSVLRLLQ